MRFIFMLAAFFVAAAAASIVGAAPLPDVGSGQAEADDRAGGARGRRYASGVYACCDADSPHDHGLDATLYDGAKVSLKSWFGDFLQRSDYAQGVVPVCSGASDQYCSSSAWFAESIGDEWALKKLPSGKFTLQSWKGDYLHRSDSAQGVTTWSTDIGNEWDLEVLESGKITLKSWKGDYLHRAFPFGTTSVTSGLTTTDLTWIGIEWTVELATPIYKTNGAFDPFGGDMLVPGPGQNGVGKSYDMMAEMCTAAGSTLCSVDQVCPDGGANTSPIGGTQNFDDMWLPVKDAAQPGGKQWVQVGRRAGGTCNRLTAYHAADTAGSWMETTQHVAWKQMYACCGGSYAVSVERGSPNARRPTYKYDGAVNAGENEDWVASQCAASGSTLCSIDQVCPDGANTAPVGGVLDFDVMFLQVVDPDHAEQIVQVGRSIFGSCFRETDWGTLTETIEPGSESITLPGEFDVAAGDEVLLTGDDGSEWTTVDSAVTGHQGARQRRGKQWVIQLKDQTKYRHKVGSKFRHVPCGRNGCGRYNSV